MLLDAAYTANQVQVSVQEAESSGKKLTQTLGSNVQGQQNSA